MLLSTGCQTFLAPPATQETAGSPVEEPVVRGQSPQLASVPWGVPYVVPGEASCSPAQIPVYGEIFAPPMMGVHPGATGSFIQPSPQAAATRNQAGWLDVLPGEGGAISPDFGLPRNSEVANRVPNPLYVAATNPDATWEMLADELTKYFPIQSEQRVQQTAGVLTEGRFETPWRAGATVLEPWRNDSVGSFNRWQSTLQTIRRRATVRVIPAAGGYELEVRVVKQLEDLSRPERASAGAASLRNDAALPTDRLSPIDPIRESERWVTIGRDEPLEQEMLRRFRSRLTGA